MKHKDGTEREMGSSHIPSARARMYGEGSLVGSFWKPCKTSRGTNTVPGTIVAWISRDTFQIEPELYQGRGRGGGRGGQSPAFSF